MHPRSFRAQTETFKGFNVGDRIEHEKFGPGVIVALKSGSEEDSVSVQLDNPVEALTGPTIVNPNELKKVSNLKERKRAVFKLELAGDLDDGMISVYTGCIDSNGRESIAVVSEECIVRKQKEEE